MDDVMTKMNVQYNIPRVQVQMAGKQNRLTDGDFTITPSMAEPIEFVFGNQDGKPLSLVPFTIQFVVWIRDSLVESAGDTVGSSNIIMNKKLLIDDPYANSVTMLLNGNDTLKLGQHAAGNALKWSLFMINSDGDVFPMQVSQYGGRAGNLHVALADGFPLAEIIKTTGSR